MHQSQLSPASQGLALLSVSTPPAEAVFFHQADILLRAGLCTQPELDCAAALMPSKGPFLFIPEPRALPFEARISIMLGAIAKSYRGGMPSRVDLKLPTTDRLTPEEPYFITYYDEIWSGGPISAEECVEACSNEGRSPLTVMELAYRLLYFPRALGEVQFAAAGSRIERGEKELHVPVFSLPQDSGPLILGSFLWEHHSAFTLFPSCKKRVPVSHPRH